MAEMPWFKFYPSDWLGTGLLRLAPHAVKGFYIDLLCIMFDCESRGRLEAGGVPLTEEEVAGSINGNPTENLSHLRWLVAKGVLSKDDSGVIYSRRMVKDETRRKAGSEAGRKGGGNPHLTKDDTSSQTYIGKPKGNREKPIYLETRDQKLDTRDQIPEGRSHKPEHPPNPPEGKTKPVPEAIPEGLDTPEFRVAFSDWQKFKRERGQGYKPTGLRTLLRQLAEWGPEKSILAIQNSMASNYAGLFEPRAGPGSGSDLFVGLRDFVDSGGKK